MKNKSITSFLFYLLILNVAAFSQNNYYSPLPLQLFLEYDTTFVDGKFNARHIEADTAIDDVTVQVKYLDMNNYVPTETYNFLTDELGEAPFTQDNPSGLPVFIDIIDNINNYDKLEANFTASNGGVFRGRFNKPQTGTIEYYDMSGKQVFSQSFSNQDDVQVIPNNDLANGAYIARVTTPSQSFTHKFAKTTSNRSIPQNDLEQTMKGVEAVTENSADIRVIYSREGFKTDSLDTQLNEGEYHNIDLFLEPTVTEYDTIWGEGVITTRNENGNSIPHVNLELKPLEMNDIVPDMIFNYNSEQGALVHFSQNNDPANGLPVAILEQGKSNNNFSALYQIKWSGEGIITDSANFTIQELYNIYNVIVEEVPPLNLDINFTIYNLNDERVNNTLVTFDQVGGSHQVSGVADANGELSIEDLIAGEDYFVEIGGVDGYKAWSSTTINDLIYSVPEEEDLTPADTLIERNVTMYPDQVVANGETVSLSADYNRAVVGNYNIMLSLYNKANYYINQSEFTSNQLNAIYTWQGEFTALTGVPLFNSTTEFDVYTFMDDFDPYTVDESIVGTNVERGNNNTYGELRYYMPNTGEAVIVGAHRIEVSISNREGLFKEILRTQGYLQAGSGFMAGTAQPMTNTEAGMVGTNYLMGVARFQNEQHNFEPIKGMIYLKEEMSGKNTSSTSNTNAILYISPKVK